MTEASFRNEDVAVYDDVLPADRFQALLRHLNAMSYTSVHASEWRKVWRLHDGNPLTSRAFWYHAPDVAASEAPAYPTGTPIDDLTDWITGHAGEVEDIIGTPPGWDRLSLAPWIYPPGSGLSLHQDGNLYTGAFTYFAHPDWRLHWGGQLMVLDRRTQARGVDELWPPFLDDAAESVRAFDPGFALTIFPKPNRLVFISPTALHLLTRVDVNAGQSSRLSVAGFFHKPASR
ncbi:2OG-Fe(II) oxygenase [Catenulispora yoronensis]|uniref:2OG-Fe(II) oxygenase n=1 Tax=Catenulispora yoronensis TaxID=450799 RepID=A0ABN2UUK0_9ACTN